MTIQRHASLVLALLALITAAAPAQYYERVDYDLASGISSNAGTSAAVVWSGDVVVSGAMSLRLAFAAVELGDDRDAVIVTSRIDGAKQRLTRYHLKLWRNSTAYFNGDHLTVELELQPGSRGHVVIRNLTAQVPPPGARNSLCFGTDERVASAEPRVCRLVDGVGTTPCTSGGLPVECSPCTGFLVNDRSVVVSAGHCNDTSASLPVSAFGIAQFMVPSSSGAGTMGHPGPADQFPVDASSIVATSAPQTIGADWAVMRLHPNTLGETASAKYGWYDLASPAPVGGTGYIVRVTGYGADSESTKNYTQQTDTGTIVSSSTSTYGHQADTRGGNSGGPIILQTPVSEEVIGIHTNGGCTSTGGANLGTNINNVAFQAALTGVSGCEAITLSDSTMTLLCTPTIFNVAPVPVSKTIWNVVGLSSPYDWDMSLETVSSAASFDEAEFMVSNGHLGTGTPNKSGMMSFGLFFGVPMSAASTPATAEHQAASGLPLGEAICETFLPGQVLDLYEFTVPAFGLYEVNIGGDPSLKWRLFEPGAGPEWRSRSTATASGTAAMGPVPVALGPGVHAIVVYKNGGPAAGPLPVTLFVGAGSTVALDVFTSGGGVGDLCLNVGGIPGAAVNVMVLVSTFSAGGTGPLLGIAPSPLTDAILFSPPVPGNLLHFPVAGSPYISGAVSFPAGTFSAFTGMLWEARAIAYNPATGFFATSPIKPIPW